MKAISLEREYESYPEPMKSDVIPGSDFPRAYLSFDDDRIKDLPDSGTFTVKYRVVERSTRERAETENHEGKTCCSADIELLEITDIKGDTKEEPSTAEVLKKAFKSKS